VCCPFFFVYGGWVQVHSFCFWRVEGWIQVHFFFLSYLKGWGQGLNKGGGGQVELFGIWIVGGKRVRLTIHFSNYWIKWRSCRKTKKHTVKLRNPKSQCISKFHPRSYFLLYQVRPKLHIAPYVVPKQGVLILPLGHITNFGL